VLENFRDNQVCGSWLIKPEYVLIRVLVSLTQLTLAALFSFVGGVDNYALESGAVHSHLPTDIDGAASM